MEEKKPPAEEMLKDGLLLQEIKGFDLLHKNELLVQEINELKEENNSLKMKIRDLEQSSQSKQIESLKKAISGQNSIIEGMKKIISGLFTMNDELNNQLNLNDN